MAPFPVPRSLLRSFGVFCVDTTQRVVALSYDDGPHPAHTPGILDVFADAGAHATFFVLAEQARAHPGLVRRIVAEGHELALHGDDHTALTTLPDSEALTRLARAREQVEQIAGRRVRLFRPPYGKHTAGQARGIRAMGMELVIWSSHAWDWIDADAATVARTAWEGVFPGGIVLLHDHRADPQTLGPHEALPTFDKADVARSLLQRLEAEGYSVATVGDLIAAHREVRSALRDRMRRE
ncbi:polysaccharide deacetylase family protein [Microbacterium sp. CPCC 204701]|uniref:polysaccharide deacetylase family protein n=1 Tax=Microbacterium sp. CPCC 204701 TaxID=2493084 RepID=UPI0013E3CFEE|nr:polysaccharide deacetylase family protein [Microbacterium sp. CPCC 204701]